MSPARATCSCRKAFRSKLDFARGKGAITGWLPKRIYCARVIKRSKPRRQTVAPAPSSRIRREPPGRVPEKKLNPYPTEREILTVVIGVILFALALTVVWIGFSDITSR
jgi:hypothetical protein